MRPNPSPDPSALPGARALAVVSLAALAVLVAQVLAAPALAGLLAVVLGFVAAVALLPLGVVALGRALAAAREDRSASADGAPSLDDPVAAD